MPKVSQYDILSLLAKKMAIYAATQWLKTPSEDLQGDTPSEWMKKGKIQEVYDVLCADLKKEEK